jgi:hypothetical protein
MSRRILPAPTAFRQLAVFASGSLLAAATFAAEPNFPITPQQRATAQKTADAGVPLSEVLPTAPDVYTVKTRDTLWDISKMYLKSPWRWPELWGMNLEQVKNRVLLSRGDTAYVRGDLGPEREYRIFREPRPLRDPTTKEILGYEATYVGASEYTVQGETRTNAQGKAEIIPATFTVTSIRKEAGVGDRLSPVQAREYTNYAPHPPAAPISGQIVSIYGDALTAGQNQIVALNRGAVDGIERGHVLALFRDGKVVNDPTEKRKVQIKLPDERHGVLFVFRVFSRMSYALILSVKEPVSPGDRFTQP